MNKNDLENRLIDFTILVNKVCVLSSQTELGKYVTQQLIRSGLSSALNYGEAQGAESEKDFVHKLKISLKELRESHVTLKIIERAGICSKTEELYATKDECNQLISIFVSSLNTIQRKKLKVEV